ncbi:hypothetical protein [Sorangium sp. So ce1151]|uniref:hypothetical protein n=1 Tax=Sorangium sp. So ce1151 TaxID=3133332 RepID=UPI003F60DBAF
MTIRHVITAVYSMLFLAAPMGCIAGGGDESPADEAIDEAQSAIGESTCKGVTADATRAQTGFVCTNANSTSPTTYTHVGCASEYVVDFTGPNGLQTNISGWGEARPTTSTTCTDSHFELGQYTKNSGVWSPTISVTKFHGSWNSTTSTCSFVLDSGFSALPSVTADTIRLTGSAYSVSGGVTTQHKILLALRGFGAC